MVLKIHKMKENLKMCKIISICAIKGGCGKTTSFVNISAALVKNGYSVLLVDNDPQASVSISLGIKSEDAKNNLATAVYSLVAT